MAADAAWRAAGLHSTWITHMSALQASEFRKEEEAAQAVLYRDIYGNPFRPVAVNPDWLAWNDGTVPKLAHAIYDERAFNSLPVLADALEDAGCTDADLLNHLRDPGPHVRGCWALDRILGMN
jgi:hypothetical protein